MLQTTVDLIIAISFSVPPTIQLFALPLVILLHMHLAEGSQTMQTNDANFVVDVVFVCCRVIISSSICCCCWFIFGCVNRRERKKTT